MTQGIAILAKNVGKHVGESRGQQNLAECFLVLLLPSLRESFEENCEVPRIPSLENAPSSRDPLTGLRNGLNPQP